MPISNIDLKVSGTSDHRADRLTLWVATGDPNTETRILSLDIPRGIISLYPLEERGLTKSMTIEALVQHLDARKIGV